MQAKVRLPKAFSVRDSHEFYPIQHLAERLNPRLMVVHVAVGYHVQGDRAVFWGLVCLRGQLLAKNEVETALREAGFDFQRSAPIDGLGLLARHTRDNGAQATAAVVRLPEAKIKRAILHAETAVRETALHYFSDAHSRDASVMPLVIEAVETFGRDKGLSFLQDAENLAQSEPTVQWLIEELRTAAGVDHRDRTAYCFAVASLLTAADPVLLVPHKEEILALDAFPESLRSPLHERLEMAFWDWDQCWAALEYFGLDTLLRNQVTPAERRYAGRLIEAMARHRDKSPLLLGLLKRPYRGKDRLLVRWLEPEIVAVLGAMRLEEAIPLLMTRAKRGDVHIVDDSFDALGRIGTPAVVTAVERIWWDAKPDLRASLAGVLEDIHTDTSVTQCLAFLAGEEDAEVQLLLANALLGNFAMEGVEVVWQLLTESDEQELGLDQRELRERLVIVATITGQTFPAYEQWRAAMRGDQGESGR